MYRLMIIDDEPIVRAGIRELITWEDYGFTVCAEGTDGRDGLEKVMALKPDLVLADIKMPGLNGLELIREAKSRGFSGRFILLTGYSDFAFAKTAITLGVRAYLLKPVDEEELVEYLKELLEELEAKKHLDDYYTLSELKARKEVLKRLLLSAEQTDELKKELKLYGVNYDYPVFCVAVAYADEDMTGTEAEKLEKAEYLTEGMADTDFLLLEQYTVLIGRGCSYKEFFQKLQKNNARMEKKFGISYFITAGHDVANWEDIHFAYESAIMLQQFRFLYKEKAGVSFQILEESRTDKNHSPFRSFFLQDSEKKTAVSEAEAERNVVETLGDMIELGDGAGIETWGRQYIRCFEEALLKEHEVKAHVTEHSFLLRALMEKRFPEKRNQFPDFDKLLRNIRESESLGEAVDCIEGVAEALSGLLGDLSSSGVIQRVLTYMERNYEKEIKLEAIARKFHYNSAYLGKVFKKETGESFNNVLDSIRIQNAKRLLSETELKVYQVSEQVGYSNIDYFYSKFKKYVGISPKEYKKADCNSQ